MSSSVPPPPDGSEPSQPGPQQPEQPQLPQQAAHGAPYGPEGAPPRRRRRGLVVALVVAAVVLVVGGAAGAAAFLKLAPRGAQPDTVLPADTIAMVRLDLDPSAGQKVAAARFLTKLPDVAKTGDDVDLKQSLWKAVASSDEGLAKLDYRKDVEPWLGDRAAVAVLPGGSADKPHVVIALETTDQAKAKAGIAEVAAAGGAKEPLDVTARDDYALVTAKDVTADLTAGLAKGTLASSSTYTADLAALGDTGVASMWVDTPAALKSLGSALPTGAVPASALSKSGRVAASLRFDADYVELAGVTRGGAAPTSTTGAGAGKGLTTLPADTMAAVQLSGLGEAVKANWSAASAQLPAEQLDAVQQQLGVSLPDDLAVLLGSRLTLAMPKQDLQSLGGSDVPTIGLESVTTDPARAETVVTKVTELSGVDNLVSHQVSGDTLYLATTPDYLKALTGTGTLGSSTRFTTAVPDAQKATASAYVDLEALRPILTQDASADAKPLLQSLTAAGFSATIGTDGSGSFSFRVL
ncbi:DUF3352 domain-containing protein, partial [Lapillicoccus jejuensis]